MTTRARSTVTFVVLLAILVLAAALNTVLPQGDYATLTPTASPIPKWQLALASAAMTLVLYGLLGFLGLTLWRRMGFPDLWDERVANRQRFLVPALIGAALGGVLIVCDVLLSPVNGMGRFMHPPFPTSVVASVSAGIGEEMIFRLFFISFWTWLVGKVILRGRGMTTVYWVVAVFSALGFAAGHLPSLMIITGASDPLQFPPLFLVEVFVLNGLIALACAYTFKRWGYLAPVGVHFWADVVWHVVWGLF